MLDLSTPGLDSWLKQHGAYDFCELPEAVQRAEADPNVETALVALGIALDEESQRDPKAFKTRAETGSTQSLFLNVFAQLGQLRLLRLLVWLAEPGMPQRQTLLAALFSPDAPYPAAAVQAAVRSLSRQVLVRRLMHRERLELLLSCCQQYQLRHSSHRKAP